MVSAKVNCVQQQPYPWSVDSREDRAKRVAKSNRDLLVRIAAGRCEDVAGSSTVSTPTGPASASTGPSHEPHPSTSKNG